MELAQMQNGDIVDNQQQNQNSDQDDFDFKDIISKKKEKYRIEIRRKKTNELLAKTRNKAILNLIQNQQKRVFNTDQEKLQYVVQMLELIETNIATSRTQMNEDISDAIMYSVCEIIDTVVKNDKSEPQFIGQIFNLGIVHKILPIIEEEQFNEYIFLLNNTYNLYGTLFFTDDVNFLEDSVDDRVICQVLKSLNNSDPLIIQQGLFAVGNLIAESRSLKLKAYDLGFVQDLFQIHKENKLNTDEQIKDYVWVISQFLRDNEPQSFRKNISTKDFKFLIEISFDLASNSNCFRSQDKKTVRLIFKNILDSIYTDDKFIEYFFSLQNLKNVDLFGTFLNMMTNCTQYDLLVIQHISRFIFNVISGPNEYIDMLMQNNILDIFQNLFQKYQGSVIFQSEVVFAISNFCVINSKFIQKVMDHRFYSFLLSTYDTYRSDIQREILYIAINIFQFGKLNQIREIVESEFMSTYINALGSDDIRLVLSLLKGLDKLLDSFSQIFTADGENIILCKLHKHNFVNQFNELQYHKEKKVYESVANIIQKHLQYSD